MRGVRGKERVMRGFHRNLLKNVLEMSTNALKIHYKLSNVCKNFLDCFKNVLENSREFLETSKKFPKISTKLNSSDVCDVQANSDTFQ